MRWTLAHELGHIVLHHHLPMPGQSAEEEANLFASEFLMPAADIRGYFTAVCLRKFADLKACWKVSMQALIMRAAHLNRITEGQKSYYFTEMSRYGLRSSEPVTIPREEPTLIDQVIQIHLSELGYSEDELGRALSVSTDEFRHQYRPQVPGLRLIR